jgi:hypothetical protein
MTGIQLPAEIRIFLFATASIPDLGPYLLPMQRLVGVKQPELHSDHSPTALLVPRFRMCGGVALHPFLQSSWRGV